VIGIGAGILILQHLLAAEGESWLKQLGLWPGDSYNSIGRPKEMPGVDAGAQLAGRSQHARSQRLAQRMRYVTLRARSATVVPSQPASRSSWRFGNGIRQHRGSSRALGASRSR